MWFSKTILSEGIHILFSFSQSEEVQNTVEEWKGDIKKEEDLLRLVNKISVSESMSPCSIEVFFPISTQFIIIT